jgi:hypothetical protein
MNFLKSIFPVFTFRKAVFDFTDFRTGERFTAKAVFKGAFDYDDAVSYIKAQLPRRVVPVEWTFKGIEG